MVKVAVLGGAGLLGSTLMPIIRSAGFDAVSLGRSAPCDCICDVGDYLTTKKILDHLRPDVMVNLIALTNVDECEKNPNIAYGANVQTVENLVSWVEQHAEPCHLIQVSTDQVYDGGGPHHENDVSLTNYYAFSKYAAELVALRARSTVVRTNFFGKSDCINRHSFTDWLYESIRSKSPISLFDDVYFSPLSIKTVSELLVQIIKLRPRGVYNLGSREGLSKACFALSFAEKIDHRFDNATVTSIDDADFIETYRPKDMRLNVSKVEKELGIVMPILSDEIDKIVGEYYE